MPCSETKGSNRDPLLRLRDGDEDALADLFAQHQDRLRQIISVRLDRRLAARIDADDVLQEVYLDAAARIQHFINSHSGSFFVWLRLITTQTMTNLFRTHLDTKKRDAKRDISLQTGRTYESQPNPIAMQLLGHLTSPSRAAMREEAAKQLEEAIDTMKPMDREIISLRHFEQLDNHEVAEVLGINEKAASIRYIRAIARLKDLISDFIASETDDSP